MPGAAACAPATAQAYASGAHALSAVLTCHSHLQTLLLDECHVSAGDMELLAPAIAHHADLCTLSFNSATGVSAPTAMALCDHLTGLSKLTSLGMSCHEASDDAWGALSGGAPCLLSSTPFPVFPWHAVVRNLPCVCSHTSRDLYGVHVVGFVNQPCNSCEQHSGSRSLTTVTASESLAPLSTRM